MSMMSREYDSSIVLVPPPLQPILNDWSSVAQIAFNSIYIIIYFLIFTPLLEWYFRVKVIFVLGEFL